MCVYETERETTAEGDRERWLDKRTVLENAIIRFPFQQLADAGLRTGDCSTAKKHTQKKQQPWLQARFYKSFTAKTPPVT